MRLIVEDEDVLLPANLATQNAFDERCVAFHIAIARDARVLHVAVVVLLLVDHLNQPEGHLATVLLARQIPPSPRRRRLRADVDDFRHRLSAASLHDASARAAGL